MTNLCSAKSLSEKNMESKKSGTNYLILRDGEKFPFKSNCKKTIATIDALKKQAEKMCNIINDVYCSDYNLYSLIRDELFNKASIHLTDGSCWSLKYLASECGDMIDYLNTHQDEIPSNEEIVTLEDFGYRSNYAKNFWERVIKDTDEEEIVDEIFFIKNGEWSHRLRTTKWKKTDYGKTSESIIYRNLKTKKELLYAINNTLKEINK